MTEVQAASIVEEEEALIDEFELFEDWRDKIEYIIELGKGLAPIEDKHRIESNLVRGCQSQVWLVADFDQKANAIRLKADSDAIIVKGLIALVLRLYNNRPPEIVAQSSDAVFDKIGLGKHLTPGRANGLEAMIRKVRQYASAFLSAQPGS